MNTVLTQEVFRYNKLLIKIKEDLELLIIANQGLIIINDMLELMSILILRNEVPDNWTEQKGVGYLSVKPLSYWIIDLNERVKFFNNWVNEGVPKIFWISGLFFPQAFITGLKQN